LLLFGPTPETTQNESPELSNIRTAPVGRRMAESCARDTATAFSESRELNVVDLLVLRHLGESMT
jgi:hypothetical protein